MAIEARRASPTRPPTAIRINGFADLDREVFGPVLHVATFEARDLDRVIDAINATGYGLTFGLHTRIDDRVQSVTTRIRAGNTYVNRNQIGAVVGSQPFGGEGLSGTGPKAGGPAYLTRFTRTAPPETTDAEGATAEATVRAALSFAPVATVPVVTHDLPGPTGESNRLSAWSRPPLLCLGPSPEAALAQAEAVRRLGGLAIEAPGLNAEALQRLVGFSGALWWGPGGRAHAQALAARPGPILPLIGDMPDFAHAVLERHVCIDTTASGGNAQLLADVSAG